MRYLLLVIAAVGTTFGLANYAIYSVLPSFVPDSTAKGISIIGAFVIVLLLFGIAHQRAGRAARALVAREQWELFPPPGGDALERASLQRMTTHVDQVMQNLPAVAGQRLDLHWNDSSADHLKNAGMAFGYRDRQHLCLNEGMHAAFLNASHTKEFLSVLLHELGHVANRDVSRTTFSIELGRTFTQLAAVLATITIGFLLFYVSRRRLNGMSDQNDVMVLGVIMQIAVSAVLITALIEVIRASVLRVREYYADTRARQWLGSAAPLIDGFERRAAPGPEASAGAPPAVPGIVVQRSSPPRRALWQLIRDYLAPLHPSNKRRINALENPSALFEVDFLTVFVASLLIGIGLSASSLVFALPFQLGDVATVWLLHRLDVQTDSTLWYAILALALLIAVATFGALVGLFVTLCLVPLVGTVGVMVQRAAFVDRTRPRQESLLPLRRLLMIALLVGSGVVLGGAITPTPGVLSLQQNRWLLAPAFAMAWAIALTAWLLPLRWFAGRVYRSHVGPKPPTVRRRSLAVLASLAITPVLLLTMVGQGAVISADLNATSAGLLPSLVLGWLLSLPLSFVIWSIGALFMWLAGWFGPARCPACAKTASYTRAITLHCTHCGEPLIAWAVTPAPISIPPLPPLPTMQSDDAPPALNGPY
ncbi:MAG: M48 family metalloprotease [Chloroflexales bacterium]|nr:M48 family metalloprotease [Chloroflexales bacterium]